MIDYTGAVIVANRPGMVGTVPDFAIKPLEHLSWNFAFRFINIIIIIVITIVIAKYLINRPAFTDRGI